MAQDLNDLLFDLRVAAKKNKPADNAASSVAILPPKKAATKKQSLAIGGA